MNRLRSDEIAIRRDLFNGLVDELTDALGWLLVIREEIADVLAKACGRFDMDQRLVQMSAILSGRAFDKRYEVEEASPGDKEFCSAREQKGFSRTSPGPDEKDSAELEAWKRTLEEDRDEDSHNTLG